MSLNDPSELRPTLWRTCRVLANHLRLRMLRDVIEHPDQTVSTVATRIDLPLAVTSKYLRALNARGLLAARRVADEVHYRAVANRRIPESVRLLKALARTFQTERQADEVIFRLATAFTHPRRVLITRVLKQNTFTKARLHMRTAMSEAALTRHLKKLSERGFVVQENGRWRCARQSHHLAKVLMNLACAE